MPHFAFDVGAALGLGRDATALTFTQISLRGISCSSPRWSSSAAATGGSSRRRPPSTQAGIHPGVDAGSRGEWHRGIFPDARWRPCAGHAASCAGVLVSPLSCVRLLIKGRSDVIVRDGQVDDALAKRNRLSEHDLLEDLRLHGNVGDVREVRWRSSSGTGTSAWSVANGPDSSDAVGFHTWRRGSIRHRPARDRAAPRRRRPASSGRLAPRRRRSTPSAPTRETRRRTSRRCVRRASHRDPRRPAA